MVRRVFDPIGVAAREAAKQSSEQVWATSEFQLGERETLPSELLTDNGSANGRIRRVRLWTDWPHHGGQAVARRITDSSQLRPNVKC